MKKGSNLSSRSSYVVNMNDGLPIASRQTTKTELFSLPLSSEPLNPDPTFTYIASKDERFNFCDQCATLKNLIEQKVPKFRKLKQELKENSLKSSRLVLIAGINAPFSDNEISILQEYVRIGGILIILAESQCCAHYYNDVTKCFGITVQRDCVIGLAYDGKNTHPKICVVEDILSTALSQENQERGDEEIFSRLLYPFGSSLQVQYPAVPIMVSGYSCVPSNKALGAVYASQDNGGKLVVIGCHQMFSQKYINEENNKKFFQNLLHWLFSMDKTNSWMHSISVEVSSHHHVPDSKRDSFKTRACMQECDEFVMPGAVTATGKLVPEKLIDPILFSLKSRRLPDLVEAYETLNIHKGPIKLIKPRLETPLLQIKLAIFPPTFMDLKTMNLELYDMDEAFETPAQKLGRVTNMCCDDDLDYYVRQVGLIMDLPLEHNLTVKTILSHLFTQICRFKIRGEICHLPVASS